MEEGKQAPRNTGKDAEDLPPEDTAEDAAAAASEDAAVEEAGDTAAAEGDAETPAHDTAAAGTPAEETAAAEAPTTPATKAHLAKAAKKTAPGKSPAKKAPAKAAAKTTPAAKSTGAAKATAKAPAAKTTPAKTTPAKSTPAKSTPAKSTPADTSAAATKPAAAKSAGAKSTAARKGTPGKATPGRGTPPKGKPIKGRKPAPVAARRNIPWGMVGATALVVIFAVAAIGYAVVKVQQSKPVDPAKGLADAAKIPGIQHVSIPAREHTTDAVKYAQSPPIGGNHDATWADCSGTVYSAPIRNENAVHTMEHGAVWITYRPDLAGGDVDKLKKLVDGKNYTLMSPYPGLKSAISLQAWGFQLYLDKYDEGTIKRFLKDLRDNANNAPEPHGVCSNPDFKVSPLPPGPTPTAAPPSATPTGTVKPSGSSTATATPTKP
jgi:uncharacterized protein DUF3105